MCIYREAKFLNAFCIGAIYIQKKTQYLNTQALNYIYTYKWCGHCAAGGDIETLYIVMYMHMVVSGPARALKQIANFLLY